MDETSRKNWSTYSSHSSLTESTRNAKTVCVGSVNTTRDDNEERAGGRTLLLTSTKPISGSRSKFLPPYSRYAATTCAAM